SEVTQDEFENLSDGYIVVIHKSPTTKGNNGENSENAIIENRFFSTENEYVEFGKKYGHDFEKSLAFEKIMSEYAISSGAIQEYEKTGILPKWYSEKEKLTYDSIFKEEKELNN